MNERKLSYVYSFRCDDELEHFKKLPKEAQSNIERYIVNVICDSFVEPADEDYVTARFLAHTGMHRAFFWAASQALEKYLKAFLLMRGISVKPFKGHSVSELYATACSNDAQLSTVESKPHSAIKIHPNVAGSFQHLSVTKFLNDIDVHGSPNNRYNSFGVSFDSGYLFALDSFVYGLRQQIGVPPIQEALRKMDRSLVGAFSNYNPWFSPVHVDFPEIPNKDFNLAISGVVTTLDLLVGKAAPHRSRLVLQWLNEKMILPKKVQRYLKERS